MPTSSSSGKKQIVQWATTKKINKVLDVGCGMGTYPTLLKVENPILKTATWWGIEAWQKYIDEFNLKSLYDNILNEDARTVDWSALPDFDLVIFGDVLEHMTKEESKKLVINALIKSKYVVISIPIIFSPQGEHEGNPFEIHVKPDWSHEEVLETFPKIVSSWKGKKIGVYFLENV